MNWSASRFVIYAIGLVLSSVAAWLVAQNLGTYDAATNTFDLAPIDLTKLAASVAGMLSSGTAMVAWLKNLSRK